jgi:hypothetical protein
METSGHGAMRSNHYLDDGSHLALTAVVAFVRSRLASGGVLLCCYVGVIMLRLVNTDTHGAHGSDGNCAQHTGHRN